MSSSPPEAEGSGAARFGTFGGVFTPCTLTILGVIMFMRAGQTVGDLGLWGALAILALAKAITTLTTLSLSAIATNTEIKTGGVYYMISRTLGADFGGSIGLTLFVSQAISIAFYVIGFSEALFTLLPAGWGAWPIPQLVSTIVVIGLFGVTFKGADLAIKTQYFILAALLISVASYLIGGISGFDSETFSVNQTAHESGSGFWIVFAIFFPAATGITAGANMSGDLKDPGVAIPKGTLYSIGFTAAVYLIQLVLMAGYSDQTLLKDDPFGALKQMSVFAPLIMVGVFAATLSSALGSFLGAPRILQAMGKDKLLKPLVYFGKGHGPADEPRRATVLSLGIAIAITWAGGLDAVAEIISMFFLIAYGMINLSAFVEGRGGNPSFRPRFKMFGWPAALAGSIGCGIAMFKINEKYAIIAMVIAAGVYFWLRGRTVGDWADAKRGFVFKRARDNLMLLESSTVDRKNWRPAMAVITDDHERDRQMLKCASWIEAERGLLSVIELVEAPGLDVSQRVVMRDERVDRLREQLLDDKIVAFPDAMVVDNVQQSFDTIIQAYSIGSLRPNTVMLTVPPPAQAERRQRLADTLRALAPFNLNIVVYKGARVDGIGKRRIDLWWHGQQNGSLMALFAYLTSTNSAWSKARIRMLRVVGTGSEHLDAEKSLSALAHNARIEMDIDVVLSKRPVLELIAERSASADLVLLGLAERDIYDFQSLLENRDALLKQLPPTLLVRSNGDVDVMV